MRGQRAYYIKSFIYALFSVTRFLLHNKMVQILCGNLYMAYIHPIFL